MSLPEVQAEDRSGYEIDTVHSSGLAAAVLVRLGYSGGELGVTYVTAGEMAQLNHEYMGREGTTDVLSFPLEAGAAEVEAGFLAELEAEEQVILASLMSSPGSGSDEVPLLLGDVVICPEVAEEQAARLGNTMAQELCLLLVHGILHIAGYDHEADDGRMEQMQKKLFDEMCVE